MIYDHIKSTQCSLNGLLFSLLQYVFLFLDIDFNFFLKQLEYFFPMLFPQYGKRVIYFFSSPTLENIFLLPTYIDSNLVGGKILG